MHLVQGKYKIAKSVDKSAPQKRSSFKFNQADMKNLEAVASFGPHKV